LSNTCPQVGVVRASASRRSGSIQIARNFKVGLHLAGGTHPSFFLLGSAIDFDAGGFLIAEAYKNLRT
jgi:hypothetical protein